ncbi:MAG: flagellar assembly protein A [Bacillota bacterium]
MAVDTVTEETIGMAWVKDNKVYVRNPQEEAPPATIAPGEGVRLTVNGEEKKGPTPVREQDVIVTETIDKEEPGRIAVMVAPNKFKAFLDVRLTRRTTYRLLDSEPANNLSLETVSKTLEVMPLDREALNSLLKESNVTYGLNDEMLDGLYDKPEAGRHLIAEGVTAEPGINEKLDIRFAQVAEGRPAISENGTVDYRDLQRFISVEPGDILAVRLPGVLGKPGYRVNGEEVQPSPPKPVELIAGNGASLSNGGMFVTATVSGLPTIRQSGSRFTVSVEPLLVIKGNVDLETGNINFRGNVRIKGSITDAMKVSATGDVIVEGDVSGATVESQGALTARSIIASTVHAGGQTIFYEKLRKLTAELLQHLAQALKGIAFMLEHAAARNQALTPGGAFLILIEQKYQQVPALVKELAKLAEQAPQFKVVLPDNFNDSFLFLKNVFVGLGVTAFESIEDIAKVTKELAVIDGELLKLISSTRSKVTIQYALNSHVEATGDVLVTGQGAYNTNIQSGGKVKIDGIYRAGELNAQGNVFIGKAGSDIGVKTAVRVPSGKNIMIKKSHPGVFLQIGKQKAEVEKPMREIDTTINSEGQIELNGISWTPTEGDR